jgi:hypothetical protein
MRLLSLLWPTLVLALLSPLTAGAVTTLYYSDFSSATGANSIAGWAYVGDVGGGVLRGTAAWDNFDTTGTGTFGGDGVKGDGFINFNTGDSIAGNEYWTYSLATTLNQGDLINLSGAAFNANSSHNSTFTIVLYNVTDNRLMASSAAMGGTRIGEITENQNPFYNFSVDYLVQAEDDGDVFQIRVIENLNNVARDIAVDYFHVTQTSAVPEPSRMVLMLAALGASGLRRRR